MQTGDPAPRQISTRYQQAAGIAPPIPTGNPTPEQIKALWRLGWKSPDEEDGIVAFAEEVLDRWARDSLSAREARLAARLVRYRRFLADLFEHAKTCQDLLVGEGLWEGDEMDPGYELMQQVKNLLTEGGLYG